MAKKQLKPTGDEIKAFDEIAGEIVFESELLALILEHPHTPNHIKGTIRFLMIGACSALRTALEEKSADGQMVRDIFPHALLVKPLAFAKGFKLILSEIEKDAPRVINSIQAHADRGQTPPRYPHPLTERIPRQRLKLGVKYGKEDGD